MWVDEYLKDCDCIKRFLYNIVIMCDEIVNISTNSIEKKSHEIFFELGFLSQAAGEEGCYSCNSPTPLPPNSLRFRY